jgi:hypothetical protein
MLEAIFKHLCGFSSTKSSSRSFILAFFRITIKSVRKIRQTGTKTLIEIINISLRLKIDTMSYVNLFGIHSVAFEFPAKETMHDGIEMKIAISHTMRFGINIFMLVFHREPDE